jgi:hypothetical protein
MVATTDSGRGSRIQTPKCECHAKTTLSLNQFHVMMDYTMRSASFCHSKFFCGAARWHIRQPGLSSATTMCEMEMAPSKPIPALTLFYPSFKTSPVVYNPQSELSHPLTQAHRPLPFAKPYLGILLLHFEKEKADSLSKTLVFGITIIAVE